MIEINLALAFFAGLISFVSPCILPMVPFYLSYIAGVGVREVTSGAGLAREAQLKAFLGAVCFSLGVLTIFLALGLSATFLGSALREYFDVLKWVAAAFLIAMGLNFLGVWHIGILTRHLGVHTTGSQTWGLIRSYVIGLAFAFGWTPCVGPILAAILFAAAGQESMQQGAILLLVYGLGMTLPFILGAIAIVPFMRAVKPLQKYLKNFERVTGGALILFGVLIASDGMSVISFWLLEIFPGFLKLG